MLRLSYLNSFETILMLERFALGSGPGSPSCSSSSASWCNCRYCGSVGRSGSRRFPFCLCLLLPNKMAPRLASKRAAHRRPMQIGTTNWIGYTHASFLWMSNFTVHVVIVTSYWLINGKSQFSLRVYVCTAAVMTYLQLRPLHRKQCLPQPLGWVLEDSQFLVLCLAKRYRWRQSTV